MARAINRVVVLAGSLALLASATATRAQSSAVVAPAGWADDPPALASLVTFARGESDLRVAVVLPQLFQPAGRICVSIQLYR